MAADQVPLADWNVPRGMAFIRDQVRLRVAFQQSLHFLIQMVLQLGYLVGGAGRLMLRYLHLVCRM